MEMSSVTVASFNPNHRLTIYSTATFTLPLSSAFGMVTVSTPSLSFADTPFPSTTRGSQTVREKLDVLVMTDPARSVDN